MERTMSVGKLPAKPLRFVKEVATRNEVILKRKRLEIPKSFRNDDKIQARRIDDKDLSAVLQEEERWRGQTKKVKSYFSLTSLKHLAGLDTTERKGAIIEYLANNEETPRRSENSKKLSVFKQLETDHLSFLKNGSLKNERYFNTCAFDSFAQCILNANSSVFENKDKHFNGLIKALLNGNLKSAKVQRLGILAKLYALEWDCTANITKISDFFLKELKYDTIETSSFCKNCSNNARDSYKYLPINLAKLDELGIRKLNDCVKDPDILYCSCGGEKIISEIYPGPVAFVYSECTVNDIGSIYISNIPDVLKVYNESYTISGFVSYIETSSHYVAYCYRNNRWEKYDDLMQNAINIKFPHTHQVNPHLIIYKNIK